MVGFVLQLLQLSNQVINDGMVYLILFYFLFLSDFIVNTNCLDSFKNLLDEHWKNYHYFYYD